jgi:hypothetical protein
LARAVTDADRALLLLFLTKRFDKSPALDKERLRGFLKETSDELHWTNDERMQMLGE